MAEASERRELARGQLRELHEGYIAKCGWMFTTRPFRSPAVPGWVYLPVEDTVILRSTYDEIRERGRCSI